MCLPIQRFLPWPRSQPITLLVVIDTEEEFDWNAPFDAASTSVDNIARQRLAQDIFDRHGAVPTYVVDYPVAATPASVAALRAIAERGGCEIGAHLHPWVNPPHEGPIDNARSYPGNLPPDLEYRKLATLTQTITDAFGRRPTTYKAGRYGIGSATWSILERLGYTVDLSVVPHTDFAVQGGPDFSAFADAPFAISEQLLEIPLSVGFAGRLAPGTGPHLHAYLNGKLGRRLRLGGIAARLGLLERLRLSPEGHDVSDLKRQTRAGIAAGKRLFVLTYHSSSLLPGAAPYVGDQAGLDDFLRRIEEYIGFFVDEIGGRPASVSHASAVLRAQEAAGGGSR